MASRKSGSKNTTSNRNATKRKDKVQSGSTTNAAAGSVPASSDAGRSRVSHDVSSQPLSRSTQPDEERASSRGSLRVNTAGPPAKKITQTPIEKNLGQKTTKKVGSATKSNVGSSPRLFALLIGINKYNNESTTGTVSRDEVNVDVSDTNGQKFTGKFGNLGGAVTDAQQFGYFLESRLQVPKSQITLLCDEKATRKAIIKALTDLASNPDIAKGDTIFIFYAGHGGRAPPPPEMKANKQGCPDLVELLIPYDFHRPPGQEIRKGIPDYTLAVLLRDIAHNKGDNITVVFDCCHSAGALRGLSREEKVRSGPDLSSPLPDDLDSNILRRDLNQDITFARGSGPGPIVRKPSQAGNTAYVFFSACASHQEAKELRNRGRFTVAFLSVLESVDDLRSLPCSNMIPNLPDIPGQSPQCEGNDISRSIFHNFAAEKRKRLFPVTPISGSTYTLKAGSAYGFVPEDKFLIFKNEHDTTPEQAIGKGSIRKVEPLSSNLIIEPLNGTLSIPSNAAFASFVGSSTAHLVLYIVDARLESFVRGLSLESIRTTQRKEEAYISLNWTDASMTDILFQVVDIKVAEHLTAFTFTCLKTDRGHLHHIFEGLSKFYWHLKRSPPKDPFFDKLFMHFYELDENNLGDLEPTDNVDLQSVNHEVLLKDSSDTPYGLKIVNNTNMDLFPCLFYFDNTNFNIVEVYHHPQGGERSGPESPLKAGSEMMIGYGHLDLGYPVTFDDKVTNQGKDVLFFKLFVSTAPLDLRDIKQDSTTFNLTKARDIKKYVKKSRHPKVAWSEISILVVREPIEA